MKDRNATATDGLETVMGPQPRDTTRKASTGSAGRGAQAVLLSLLTIIAFAALYGIAAATASPELRLGSAAPMAIWLACVIGGHVWVSGRRGWAPSFVATCGLCLLLGAPTAAFIRAQLRPDHAFAISLGEFIAAWLAYVPAALLLRFAIVNALRKVD